MTIFASIPDHPGYRVDDDGFVWSCWVRKRRPTGYGSYFEISDTWFCLSRSFDQDGYFLVTLYDKNKVKRTWKVARLILWCFTGMNPPEMQAAHEDGVRTNNALSNLFWKTPKQNEFDKIRHGTSNHGERGGSAKITKAIVLDIRKRESEGVPQRELAEEYELSPGHISNICARRVWYHI